MKVTYEQLLIFRNSAQEYKNRHGGKFSPLLYCIEKMLNKTKVNQDDYDDDSREINQNLAEKNDGFFVMEKFGKDDSQERYRISAENTMARDKKIRDLLRKEIDVSDPVILQNLKDLPKDINLDWWSALSPFVLPELTDEIALELMPKEQEQAPALQVAK